MSGPFEEAVARLQACKARVEEAVGAVRGGQEIVGDAHAMLEAVYDGVDAGHDVLNAIDLADNHADEVLEVLQRVLDLLDEKMQAAMRGEA